MQKLSRMFDFEPARMLVIYDDIDLPLGSVRLRERGSAGTHKGMKSVIQHCGSQEFPRLRIGIQDAGHKPAEHHPLRADAAAAASRTIVPGRGWCRRPTPRRPFWKAIFIVP